MRTQEQIAERAREIKKVDQFGIELTDLVLALTYKHAKEFIEPHVTQDTWDSDRPEYKPDDYRQQIRVYLPLAFKFALDRRMLPAARSIAHFRAWIWLACDDDILAQVEAIPYSAFGFDKLKVIEGHYGPMPEEMPV